MTKEEILRKHKQYLFPSISTYFSEPLVTDHATMQYLWDTEGNKYLDFFGGIVTISVGHTNPRVTSKVKAQIDKLQHASTLFPNEAVVALAEKIAQITPGEISQSFFSNSGSEAMRLLFRLPGCIPATTRWSPYVMDTADARSSRSRLLDTEPGANHYR